MREHTKNNSPSIISMAFKPIFQTKKPSLISKTSHKKTTLINPIKAKIKADLYI